MLTGQNGNALFLILIAVALFAALSYALTQSTRGGGNIDREEQMIAQAVSEQCSASIDYAVNKLTLILGCSTDDINYDIDSDAVDKSCHVYEPEGGGAIPCGTDSGECDLAALDVGEKCENADIVYAGELSEARLYTTAADRGIFQWSNGGVTTATSPSDGRANTDILVNIGGPGAPYAAANACHGLPGGEWYLPAENELNVLYTHREAIGGFDTSGTDPDGYYWSSTQVNSYSARDVRFSNGSPFGRFINEDRSVRCVRR